MLLKKNKIETIFFLLGSFIICLLISCGDEKIDKMEMTIWSNVHEKKEGGGRGKTGGDTVFPL